MYKALAVLRTAFLLFIVGYTLWSAPDVFSSAVETVRIDALRRANHAAWIAVAWIAFDTAIGWILIRFRRKPSPAPPSAPPPIR